MKHTVEVRAALKSYGSGKNKKIILNGLNMNVDRSSM